MIIFWENKHLYLDFDIMLFLMFTFKYIAYCIDLNDQVKKVKSKIAIKRWIIY